MRQIETAKPRIVVFFLLHSVLLHLHPENQLLTSGAKGETGFHRKGFILAEWGHSVN